MNYRMLIATVGLVSYMSHTYAAVITDGEFSGWSFASVGEGTATVLQEASGGNPDERVNITTVTRRGITAWGTAIKPDYSTNRVLKDTQFVLELDVLSGRGAFGDGQAIALLVEQNSSIYAKPLDVTGYPRNWDTLSFQSTFTEDSFTLWAGSGPSIPDFSGNTNTKFGFAGGNSWSNTVTHYYDNFKLELVPLFTGDFEDGWVDWHAETGVWDVGMPSTGPSTCRSGEGCAGTNLEGTYFPETDSRLISAPISLPVSIGAEGNILRFWHWHSYQTNDTGHLQIAWLDEPNGWTDWATLASFTGGSGGWIHHLENLTDYAGKTVRLAFYHEAASPSEDHGWFIDHIRLPGVYLSPCKGDFDNDGDVDGSDLQKLSPHIGRTDCSLADFCTGDFDNDGDVDGTDLAGFSEDFGSTQAICFATPGS